MTLSILHKILHFHSFQTISHNFPPKSFTFSVRTQALPLPKTLTSIVDVKANGERKLDFYLTSATIQTYEHSRGNFGHQSEIPSTHSLNFSRYG